MYSHFFSRIVSSAEFESSVWSGISEGAHGDNGSLIIGVNKKTKIISGYYEANDITGNITAECKFYFTGSFQADNSINIRITSAYPDFIKDKSNVVQGKMKFPPTKAESRSDARPFLSPNPFL